MIRHLFIWFECLLFKHDWLYCSKFPINGDWKRECKRCGKRMYGLYDTTNGTTIWKNGWN